MITDFVGADDSVVTARIVGAQQAGIAPEVTGLVLLHVVGELVFSQHLGQVVERPGADGVENDAIRQQLRDQNRGDNDDERTNP